MIGRAEAGTGLKVAKVAVEFTAAAKTVGATTPQLWFLPKDLLAGELAETTTQRVAFELKRREVALSSDRLAEDVAEAIEAVRAGLRALERLKGDFAVSARVELAFELSREGKIEFFAKAGASREDAHALTLELLPEG